MIAQVISAATIFFLAIVYSPEQIGLYAAAIGFGSVLGVAAGLGLDQAVQIENRPNYAIKVGRIAMSSANALGIIGVAIGFIIILLGEE